MQRGRGNVRKEDYDMVGMARHLFEGIGESHHCVALAIST